MEFMDPLNTSQRLALVPSSPTHILEVWDIWTRIEPRVCQYSPKWSRRAGYPLQQDDYPDLVSETKVRFLSAYKITRSKTFASILAFARRCCLTAARTICSRKDAMAFALIDHDALTSLPEVTPDMGAPHRNQITLSDLPLKLQRRVLWFAAHPKHVSREILSRLREEINLNVLMQHSACNERVPAPLNSTEQLTFIHR